MNVALYSRGAARWSLVERPVAERDRTSTGVQIGASTMEWQGDRIVVRIDELSSPLGRRLRGSVSLVPEALPAREMTIDRRGEHRWWPIAPLARIEVDFAHPSLRFSGHGYLDANAGRAPLESAFHHWTWGRGRGDAAALLTYDVTDLDGQQRALALRFTEHGDTEHIARTSTVPVGRSVWALERRARVDAGGTARLVRGLEDGPFYTRALVEGRLGGEKLTCVHEVLAAHRLGRRWVNALTRCRMGALGRRRTSR